VAFLLAKGANNLSNSFVIFSCPTYTFPKVSMNCPFAAKKSANSGEVLFLKPTRKLFSVDMTLLNRRGSCAAGDRVTRVTRKLRANFRFTRAVLPQNRGRPRVFLAQQSKQHMLRSHVPLHQSVGFLCGKLQHALALG
jgi:hypothetical protein